MSIDGVVWEDREIIFLFVTIHGIFVEWMNEYT